MKRVMSDVLPTAVVSPPSLSLRVFRHTALLAQEDQPARISIAPAVRKPTVGTHLNFFSGFEYPDCAMMGLCASLGGRACRSYCSCSSGRDAGSSELTWGLNRRAVAVRSPHRRGLHLQGSLAPSTKFWIQKSPDGRFWQTNHTQHHVRRSARTVQAEEPQGQEGLEEERRRHRGRIGAR